MLCRKPLDGRETGSPRVPKERGSNHAKPRPPERRVTSVGVSAHELPDVERSSAVQLLCSLPLVHPSTPVAYPPHWRKTSSANVPRRAPPTCSWILDRTTVCGTSNDFRIMTSGAIYISHGHIRPGTRKRVSLAPSEPPRVLTVSDRDKDSNMMHQAGSEAGPPNTCDDEHPSTGLASPPTSSATHPRWDG